MQGTEPFTIPDRGPRDARIYVFVRLGVTLALSFAFAMGYLPTAGAEEQTLVLSAIGLYVAVTVAIAAPPVTGSPWAVRAGAFVAAEKIRETVAEHEFRDADGAQTQHLTVSIGVATFPDHASDREALLKQADNALYEAKHFGRDRVRAPHGPDGRSQSAI